MKQLATFAIVATLSACSITTPEESPDASAQSALTSNEGDPSSGSANTRSSSGATGGSSTGNATATATTSGRTSSGSTSQAGSSAPTTLTTGTEFAEGSSASEDASEPESTLPNTSTQDQTSTRDASSEAPERCADGPLSAPLPDCAPEFEETGDYHADCVARINQLRWECQCLPPLERFEDGEACADEHAQYDYEADEAHAGFSAKICEPGGSGQNECPGYGGRFGVIDYCLQQMWDEGPGEDFQAHGHYINMTNEDHTAVACGTYTTPDGVVWAVQNFFR